MEQQPGSVMPAAPTAVNQSTDAGSANGLTLQQLGEQMAALTSSVNEITSKLNMSSTQVKDGTINSDKSLNTEVTGAYDVYDNKRLVDAHNHRMLVLAELQHGQLIERLHNSSNSSLQHMSALPPNAAKASGC